MRGSGRPLKPKINAEANDRTSGATTRTAASAQPINQRDHLLERPLSLSATGMDVA